MALRMVSAPPPVYGSPPFLGSPVHSSFGAPSSLTQATPFGTLGPAVHAAPVLSAPAGAMSPATPSGSAVVAHTTVVAPTVSYAAPAPGPRVIVHEIPVDENLDSLHAELEARMSLIAGLEQQNIELKSLLADAKEKVSLSVHERERLAAQVQELELEIGRLRAELTSLQQKYEEALDVNAKQATHIDQLEALVAQLRSPPVEEPAPAPRVSLGDDLIDIRVQEYLEAHPDFDLAIEKLATGSYRVGKPVDKKVFMKVSGNNVLVRTGGGLTEISKWFDEIAHQLHEAERSRATRPAIRKLGSRVG